MLIWRVLTAGPTPSSLQMRRVAVSSPLPPLDMSYEPRKSRWKRAEDSSTPRAVNEVRTPIDFHQCTLTKFPRPPVEE